MKHIVVGVDGSEGAANALRWATQVASRLGAEIVVTTGFEPTHAELRPGRLEALVARQERELAAWIDAMPIPDVEMRTVVECGDPRTTILDVADREHADLIVIGRVGRSAGPGLLHIGSMAEWLAHHVDRPVAIIGESAGPTTRSVLVGVDGSDGSQAAVMWVRDFCANSAMRVVAASVEEFAVDSASDVDPEHWRRGFERRIRRAYASDLVGADVELEVVALRGANVADVLLQAAQQQQSDLVVVGARGLGGFTGLRVGGVALRTLHLADRPVVLVPPS
jgi:nucleotide-binding universal stress UspA family protein